MEDIEDKKPNAKMGRMVRKLLDWIAKGQAQAGPCKS
jgi:hypothetical protein